MKIYLRIFLLVFLSIPSFSLENEIYSISVCTTSSLEAANKCKEEISKTSNLKAFTLENQNNSYSAFLGNFSTYNEAKSALNKSSDFIKKQKPFIKKIENKKENKINIQNTEKNISTTNIENRIKEVDDRIKKIDNEIIYIREKQALDIAEKTKKEKEVEIQKIKDENAKILVENQKIQKEKSLAEEQKKEEESKRIKAESESQKIKETLDIAEKTKKEKEVEISSQKINHMDIITQIDTFEKLIIKVDSQKNIMFLKGKNKDGEIIDIKSYIVSTAKTSIKKPQGIGSITSISLNPQWNPTSKTLKVFREKGIILPSVVPFGDNLNYMGAAKINLSHKVDGREVYRIHGTLSENTIGTNESSGCIRMKNKEVVELATLLDKFSKIKSLNNISVVLE